MQNTHESFSDNFKSMWDVGSDAQQEWHTLEDLYTALTRISDELTSHLSKSRTSPEILDDMKLSTRPEEELIVEMLRVWWNRLLLRSCLKVRDGLQLLFYSSNTANSYGCALAARSIIEHIALLEYFTRQVPWRRTRLVKKNALIEFGKHIYNLTQGSTFDWDKLLTEKLSIKKLLASKEWKRSRAQRIPNMAVLVEALDKVLSAEQGPETEGHIQFIYSALCDVVHPSWGGDFIYAPKMYRHMKAEQKLDEHFKRTATLFCLPMSEVVWHLTKLIEFMMDNEPHLLAVLKD